MRRELRMLFILQTRLEARMVRIVCLQNKVLISAGQGKLMPLCQTVPSFIRLAISP
jgi:hypothetical protein